MKLKALVLFTSALLYVAPVQGATEGGGYQGIEFFGSSLVTRQELEKGLGLKPGASYANVVKAVERLQQNLEKRRIKSNIDIANDDSGVVVTIDVMESGASGIPIRKLDSPHHVVLSSEVPFQIFDELMARRETLAQQGRPVKEEYPDGVKKFSDEPCNQYADKLLVRVPDMTNEFLSVIASDPNGMRRSKAIEVLNWAGNYPDLCYRLLPALNDASEQVRASAARFIFPRIRMLPENFPFEDLVEVFSLQLSRPSHIDRLLALRCLIETARTHQITLYAIKEYDMERLKQLDSMSIVESIQKPAHQLVQILASLPDKPTPKRPSPINEF
jgi:hypothetical protein